MVLKEQKDRVSYSIGVDIARSLRRNGTDGDVDMIARGMKDLLDGADLLMTDEEMKEVTRYPPQCGGRGTCVPKRAAS